MKTNKIMKDNKLIAEFMGIENDNAKMRGHLYECPVTAEYVSNLEYHTSWDWLKPVVDEIEMRCQGVPQELLHLSLFSARQEVYQAVVEFIKHLNK